MQNFGHLTPFFKGLPDRLLFNTQTMKRMEVTSVSQCSSLCHNPKFVYTKTAYNCLTVRLFYTITKCVSVILPMKWASGLYALNYQINKQTNRICKGVCWRVYMGVEIMPNLLPYLVI